MVSLNVECKQFKGKFEFSEAQLKRKLETAHSIWPWLVEYASFLINRGEVGHDGKTPYERCKAKRGKLMAWLSVKRFCGEDAQSVEI